MNFKKVSNSIGKVNKVLPPMHQNINVNTTMIKYRGHEITIIKYYAAVGNTVYNELYECKKCNFKMWNAELTEEADNILTCDEQIIKDIIE